MTSHRLIRPALLGLTAALLAVSVGCTPPRGNKPAVPRSGVLTGAWFHPRGSADQAGEQALWRRREADAGRRYDIAQTFYRFDKPFPSWREPWHLRQGRTPLITWGAVSTSQVNSGRHDAIIRARATSLRNLRGPVFLRWMAEMDGRAKAPLAEPQPLRERLAADARHLPTGRATNVAFVWCPNAWAWDIDNAARWYPGDHVVDWICADGYNWAPTRPGASWDSFERIFANFYNWGARKGKPMMVGEFGAIERRPGEKAAWILDMARTLRTRFPDKGHRLVRRAARRAGTDLRLAAGLDPVHLPGLERRGPPPLLQPLPAVAGRSAPPRSPDGRCR